MKINFGLALVGCLVLAVGIAPVLCRDDFQVVCSYSELYVRPLTSSTYTKITSYLSGLEEVKYDPVSDQIYYATYSVIGKINYDGTGKTTLLSNPTYGGSSCSGYNAFDLDVENRHIYYLTTCPGSMETLQRANMDGTGVITLAQDNNGQNWGDISLDKYTGDLFWAVYTPGDINRVKPDGTYSKIVGSLWATGATVVADYIDRIFYAAYYPSPHRIKTADKQGANQQDFYLGNSINHNMYDLNIYGDELWWRMSAGSPYSGHQVYHMKTDGSQSTPTIEATSFSTRCYYVHEEIGDDDCCPRFWSSYNGRCYRYYNYEKSWSDASDYCQELGAELVSIHYAAEDNFVANLASDESIWIGLTDAATEGTFVWSDGTPNDYDNFVSPQPDDANGSQNCVKIGWSQSATEWDDFDCNGQRRFVCKL